MARELVSIKGTREGLVIVLDPDREFEEIKRNLEKKIKAAKGFFQGARFIVHQLDRPFNNYQYTELENICRQHGLILNKDIHWPTHLNQTNTDTTDNTGEPARLVFRTLRSGQEVYSHHHAVIIGDVHPGAQVTAGGNIVILGKCLGNVNAGVPDNTRAIVIALRLNPGRLVIAHVEADQGGSGHNIPPGPTIAILKNNRIITKPYFRNP